MYEGVQKQLVFMIENKSPYLIKYKFKRLDEINTKIPDEIIVDPNSVKNTSIWISLDKFDNEKTANELISVYPAEIDYYGNTYILELSLNDRMYGRNKHILQNME